MQSSLLRNGRLLQERQENDPDVYEFLGFIAWYMFLVVCCIVPTVCAYRRRRMRNEIVRRRETPDAQIFFTNFRFPPRNVEEQDTAEHVERIQEALVKTTMLVEPKDLNRREGEEGDIAPAGVESIVTDKDETFKETENEEAPPSSPCKETEQPDTPPPESALNEDGDVDIVVDEEMGEASALFEESGYVDDTGIFLDDNEREFSSLELPADSTNGGRTVPAACAICLCPYEAGDQVTWSPESTCQHAFHRDCIVSWLAKKASHLCPCCRQEFCQLAPDGDDPDNPVSNEEEPPFGAMFPPAAYPGSVRYPSMSLTVTRSNPPLYPSTPFGPPGL